MKQKVHSLTGRITPELVYAAWRAVRANRGAAGIDKARVRRAFTRGAAVYDAHTPVQERAPIVVLVVDNGMYGTIRMHQERQFPGRVVGTDLVNPDFVALAESYGAYAERVERSSAFGDAFERAIESGRPALLELRVDPEAITPSATLTEIRAGKG